MIVLLIVTSATFVLARNDRTERIAFWSSWLVVIALGPAAAFPRGWGASLGVFIAGVSLSLLTAFVHTDYLRIGSKTSRFRRPGRSRHSK
ncbi:hypothetical protein LV457_11415 [Mycobacterium sp. MYCO198283]|uniref:hypothetical protein n=1 Tax=Mycobacterium sp. MYCO198283 TaxID=2883505 RepID=UPI001E5D240B|nr:hypothetical protein [Mycobacterium sp. MYCO198283]MCG5432892.1 hypothetical protein [Mycobacterium sp. MYCO198283]